MDPFSFFSLREAFAIIWNCGCRSGFIREWLDPGSGLVAPGRPVLRDISASLHTKPLLQPLLLLEFRDLGAFEGQVVHQPFRTEDETNNRILDIRGVNSLASAKIY